MVVTADRAHFKINPTLVASIKMQQCAIFFPLGVKTPSACVCFSPFHHSCFTSTALFRHLHVALARVDGARTLQQRTDS